MNITTIRNMCEDDLIEVTAHMLLRFQQQNILYSEIKEVIMNGNIIEDYPDDYPYPSCLIWGHSLQNRILHVVVGTNETRLWLITAYQPDPEQWSENFRKRKE